MPDNNSTYVPGMGNSFNGPENFNPYAQPNAGNGTYIPGMQAQPEAQESTPKPGASPVVGFLYSVSNNGQREYWPLRVGTNVIGRDADADVTLAEATVSGKHAEILVRELRGGGGLTAAIRDMGSKTGILINGTDPGYSQKECCNGDILTIGNGYKLLIILVDTVAIGLSAAEEFIPTTPTNEGTPAMNDLPFAGNPNPGPYAPQGLQGTIDITGKPMTAPGSTQIL